MKIIFKTLFIIVTITVFGSCMESVKRKIGSCYIQDGEIIKYLMKDSTGKTDTVSLSEANPAFFEIIFDELPGEECGNGNIWSRDKSNVWFRNKRITGADPETFTVLEGGYAKDNKYAFFNDEVLNGSNISGFKVLSYFYAKDEEMIWYKGKEAFGVNDAVSFEIIDGYFSKDGNTLYFNNDTLLMKIPDSDVGTFKCLENNGDLRKNSLKYYIDTNNVYVIDTESSIENKNYLLVFEAFTESFRVFPVKNFTKDNFNIYYRNIIIKDADHQSFRPLPGDYSKDKSKIFYKNKVMHGVDYKTFKVFEEDVQDFDARDSLNYFMKGKRVRIN